jgi:hypothetical protein
LRSFKNRKLLWWIGPIAAVDFFVRPTNIVPACVLGLYVSIRAPKQAIWAAAAASPIIALFVALSYDMYGTALAPYYSPQQANAPTLALHAHLAEALVGNWISPGRGLLVFCPFFLLLAVPSAWRTKLPDAFKTVGPWLISIVALHWILVSSYSDWVGGFSYGPRYMCDIVPFLIVLLTPAIHAIFQSGPGLRLDRVAFVVLVAAALFIHARGAYSMAPHDWNWQPVDINHAQRRVWDWSDPAFLRGL